MKSKVQKIIEAALTEQVLECYDALNKTLSEKLVGPIGKISESVSNRFFEGYNERRKGEKKTVKESYDAQKPEVQRAIDYVVEGITENGVGAFESLVENAEKRFGIFNDDLKNYFAEAIREDFSLKSGSSKRKVQEPIVNQQHFRGAAFKPTNQLKTAAGRSVRGDLYRQKVKKDEYAEDFSLKSGSSKRKVQEPIINQQHFRGAAFRPTNDLKVAAGRSERGDLHRQKAKKDEYAEEFQTQPAKAILDYLKGPTSGKELADKYFGPRRKKTAAQRKAAKIRRGK
jgi:hypothetical protein